LRLEVSGSYTNGTDTYTSLNTLTTGTNDQLYFTRTGNNAPLAQVVSSVSHVCKFDSTVSYWGAKAESEFLKNGNAGSTGEVNFSCDGGADATFEELVSSKFQRIF
jgi:hypothetical protein